MRPAVGAERAIAAAALVHARRLEAQRARAEYLRAVAAEELAAGVQGMDADVLVARRALAARIYREARGKLARAEAALGRIRSSGRPMRTPRPSASASIASGGARVRRR